MKKYFSIISKFEIVYVFCQKQFQFEIMNLVKNNFNFVFATLFLTPFLAFSHCKSPKKPKIFRALRARFFYPQMDFFRACGGLIISIWNCYLKFKPVFQIEIKNMFCFWTISTFRIIFNFYEILF